MFQVPAHHHVARDPSARGDDLQAGKFRDVGVGTNSAFVFLLIGKLIALDEPVVDLSELVSRFWVYVGPAIVGSLAPH